MNDDRETWTVVVVPLERDGPARGRFKKWLKAGLREFGLRCTEVRYPTADEKADAESDGDIDT